MAGGCLACLLAHQGHKVREGVVTVLLVLHRGPGVVGGGVVGGGAQAGGGGDACNKDDDSQEQGSGGVVTSSKVCRGGCVGVPWYNTPHQTTLLSHLYT